MFAPVPVTVNVELPTAVIITLPFADGIFTLLFPLAKGPIKLAADKLPVKLPVPDTFTPVLLITSTLGEPIALIVIVLSALMRILLLPLANVPTKLPDVTFPVTPKLVSVPTLVIFG